MKPGTFIDRQWMRFNPKKRNRVHEACDTPTHLFFLENVDIAILWSAKAGCTLAAKWFFYQRGELEKALEYSPWIHDYRIDIYRTSDAYQLGVHRAVFGKMRYIRFVRNPFSRAVSSYLHMVRTTGDAEFHRPFNEFLGRNIELGCGPTFREFVDFLSSIDIQQCDIHYRQQAHKLEVNNLIEVDSIVHLESVERELVAVSRRYKLKVSSIRELSSSNHNTKRFRVGSTFVGDAPHYRTEEDLYPDYRNFYDQELIERIAGIYANDFARYGYQTTP
jgi:hypothetical protein